MHCRRVDILSIARSLGRRFCTALLGIYCFTGEDCNAAFRGKGKLSTLKLLDRNPEFVEAFSKLGEKWMVCDDIT